MTSTDNSKKNQSWLNTILKYEDQWCDFWGIFNPYLDPYKHMKFSKELPMYDLTAYHKYPKHNFVYDKLWVCKSQGLICGLVKDINRKSNIEYPIFIKPRWGHKTATSKNCFKIKKYEDLVQFKSEDDMMWSEFIDETEGMTDYILHNGKIVYQMSLKYSDKQNGFIDEWKFISSDNKPPAKVSNWVKSHMNGFTGVVNVQYRGDKIIEVGLRLARGGAYIKSTNNVELVKNINLIIDKGTWNYEKAEKIKYKSFYSFKCYANFPIIFLFPQHYVDKVMQRYECKEFYEYYFEPSGKSGMVFLQFLNNDFKKGMECKNFLETTLLACHLFIILLFFTILYFYSEDSNYTKYVIIFTMVFLSLRIINPLTTQYSLWKAQKQQYFGS
jgi:hypothetical protein